MDDLEYSDNIFFQETLARQDNKVTALNALDKEVSDEEGVEFKFRDIFQKSVFHPFLVILVLMFLLQFSGQGAITFYTAQIFHVSQHYDSMILYIVYSMK